MRPGRKTLENDINRESLKGVEGCPREGSPWDCWSIAVGREPAQWLRSKRRPTHRVFLAHALIPDHGPGGTQEAVRIKNGEVCQTRFQHVALASSPVSIQGTMAHLGQGHEEMSSSALRDHRQAAGCEFRVPFENKAGYVRIKDESCPLRPEGTSLWRCS